MRRRKAKKIAILPDPKFNDVVVTKFVNNLMFSGKKSLAFKIFYDAIEIVNKKNEEQEGLDIWRKALENVTPAVEVRSRRVGGATYQVPMEVRTDRGVALALRWLVQYSRARAGRSMVTKLANELMDAANETGQTIRKREETHKMAEANKAFAHYRY